VAFTTDNLKVSQLSFMLGHDIQSRTIPQIEKLSFETAAADEIALLLASLRKQAEALSATALAIHEIAKGRL
jgi:hypothetical protein